VVFPAPSEELLPGAKPKQSRRHAKYHFSQQKQRRATLEQLAERVRTALKGVTLAGTNLLEHALAAGDALLAAKEAAGHGNWLAWLKRECDLSEDKAERYMQIARGRAKLEANSARLRNLSLSNALRVIKKSEPPGSKSSRPAAKTKKHATSLDALGWWSGASLEERRHFLEGVGVSQVVGHLSAVRLLDLLEGRLERDGINAAAPLKKLRELVDRSKTTLDLKALPAQGVA
jgi:hypothetical protein